MWLDSLHHALHVALTGEQDGYYAEFDGSLARIAASCAGRSADRRGGPEPRPGRQPRSATGSPTRSGGSPPPSSSSAPSRRSSSRARSTASGAVQVLHRPHRPVHRRRDPRGPPARVRTSPASAARCPTRRTQRSFELSKLARASPSSSTSTCCGCGASYPRARGHVRRGGAGPRAPARARDAPRRLRNDSGAQRMRSAREAVPARALVGRRGHELLALLRARRAGRTASSTPTTARPATS